VSAINADTADAWRQIAKDCEATRPSAGKRVRVTGGRKHVGKEGTVLRHQISKFGDAYRYGNDASHHMRDMMGRSGWTCQVRTEAGETFWTDADNTAVLP
jgi:hypothetical protein